MADYTSQTPFTETLPPHMYRAGLRVTWVGMAVNAVLIVVKFIGGILGASTALIADAFHSVSDFITDISVIVGLRFLRKPADINHAYGHGRIETAISMLMGIFVILTGIGILWSGGGAIAAFFTEGAVPETPRGIAVMMAFLSVLAKEGLFRYTRLVARRISSRSLEANAWHHRSDALSSVGTVIGVGGAYLLGSRWSLLDPVAAVFVSLLIIKVGFDITVGSIRELADESIDDDQRKKVEDAIKGVDGVDDYHYLRTRSLGRYITVEVHVLVNPELTVREGHDIATKTEHAIRMKLPSAVFISIHIEPHDDSQII